MLLIFFVDFCVFSPSTVLSVFSSFEGERAGCFTLIVPRGGGGGGGGVGVL